MEILQVYLLYPLCYLGLGLFIVAFAKIINDWLTPYSVDKQLAEADNPALAVSFSGYILATVIIYVAVLAGPSKGLLMDLLLSGGYSSSGVILLKLSRIINDKLLLYNYSNVKESMEDKNAGTGAVQCGTYIASGLVIAGAVHGTGGGFHTVLAFYALGQAVLILFARIYNLMTPYDIHDEIEKDNVAAGVGLGGALTAIGLILLHASKGNFIGWQENLSVFFGEALIALILLPLARLCFDKLIFTNFCLNQEIQKDRNLAAGMLEATCLIGFAALLSATFG